MDADKALREAITKKDYDGAMAALEAGANPNHTFSSGGTIWDFLLRDGTNRPIALAIEQGTPEILKLLLAYGADPNVTTLPHGGYGMFSWVTPLHKAVYANNPQAVRILLKSNAEENPCCKLKPGIFKRYQTLPRPNKLALDLGRQEIVQIFEDYYATHREFAYRLFDLDEDGIRKKFDDIKAKKRNAPLAPTKSTLRKGAHLLSNTP